MITHGAALVDANALMSSAGYSSSLKCDGGMLSRVYSDGDDEGV